MYFPIKKIIFLTFKDFVDVDINVFLFNRTSGISKDKSEISTEKKFCYAILKMFYKILVETLDKMSFFYEFLIDTRCSVFQTYFGKTKLDQ